MPTPQPSFTRSAATQTASHWGVYHVRAGAAGIDVRGAEGDPHPSPLIAGLPELYSSPLRIDRPYVREGWLRHRGRSGDSRGADPFVAVDWDTALTLVSDEITRIRETFGHEAVYGGCYGWASAGRLHHAPSVLKKFLALGGGYVDKVGNHSFGAAMAITPHVLGRSDIPSLTPTWPEVVDGAELVVMFGGSHLKNSQVDPGGADAHTIPDWYGKARAAGIDFVNVSPSRGNVTSGVDAKWIPLRPGTDTALMLGLAHTLLITGRVDRNFLARAADGFGDFERYLRGEGDDGVVKSAAWAARVTGVTADRIEHLAARMADHRTLITTSWSVQRAEHGEQPVWATIALAAMLGQIGLPGCGFGLGFGSIRGNVQPRQDIPRPKFSLGRNPLDLKVPVGRFNDMLLHPGTVIEHQGTSITLPTIELVYSAGGNPFHHNANLNRLVRGWRKPQTIVVHEQFWNPAARFADIVLPATTTLERNDILATEYTRRWVAMHQVLAPHGLARNDRDVFAELSDRLGFGADYHENRDEMSWLRRIYDVAAEKARELDYQPVDFDEFWSTGECVFPERLDPPMLSEFRTNPEGHPLDTPSGRIQISSPTVAAFGYAECPGHPSWQEPSEWLGGDAARQHPLHLLTNQPKARLHSQLDPAPASRSTKIDGREPLRMGPADAAARGIENGDAVRVFNDRGSFHAAAVIVDGLLDGVLEMSTGAWYDPVDPAGDHSPDKHGNPNVVTADHGSSRVGQAPIAQTVLVEVERAADPPPVTAFDRPRRVTLAEDELRRMIAARAG